MKHALRRTLTGINLHVNGWPTRRAGAPKHERGKGKQLHKLWSLCHCPLLARVSSIWGFGGNWRGGLPLMYQVYSVVAALRIYMSHTVL